MAAFVVFMILFLLLPCDRVERLNRNKHRLSIIYDSLDYERIGPLFIPIVFIFKRAVFAIGIYTGM
jgi:hypothetical protein